MERNALQIAKRHPDDHPVRVASRCSGDAQTVALLHDAIEDGYATEMELRGLFKDHIVDAVVVLTKTRDETYPEYIGRIKETGGLALEVKLADVEENLDRSTRDGFVGLVNRYEKAREVLRADVPAAP